MSNNDLNNKLQKDSIFKVGHVISVEGRRVRVIVDKSKNSANLLYQGEVIRNVSVNSYIKIVKGFTKIIGKVDGEFTDEDKSASNSKYGKQQDEINRVLSVSLLGFFNSNGFERGIKELPLIKNECFLLDSDEYEIVHNFIKPSDAPIGIGTLTHEKGQTVKIGVNSLFASHIGIFGNTGSGKSYTLSKIYNTLFLDFKSQQNFAANASFYLIDFNGEYVDDDRLIDRDRKSSFALSTRTDNGTKFPIKSKHVEDPDFWSLILEATEKTQAPFIRRALNSPKINDKVSSDEQLHVFIQDLIEKIIVKEDGILRSGIIIDFLNNLSECFSESNMDEILPFFQNTLKYHTRDKRYFIGGDYGQAVVSIVNEHLGNLTFNSDTSLITRIRLKLILKYHDEIIGGFANQEHLSPLINRISGRVKDINKLITVNDNPELKNISVISLRDVNVQMRKMLPFLICKQMYEEKKEANTKEKSLNIIIDEAHNILSESSERESESWKDYRLETFEEIIKEGRKFGVFLTIASQRPSDISPTIISQLHNFFLHRLINNNDIRAVEKTISYLDKLSFESLPILPTGTCIFAGLAAQVPVMIDIGKIEESRYEPDNKTIVLLDNWMDNNEQA
ncbi:MAG: DUF87 domain-containing protein [Crocinitomicaceae bacterium]|nr:DUF87 domain-containing protein [Crocinitomicaceae bacterium]